MYSYLIASNTCKSGFKQKMYFGWIILCKKICLIFNPLQVFAMKFFLRYLNFKATNLFRYVCFCH